MSLVVVAEAAWVLRSGYGFARDAVRAAMLGVIDSEQIVVERAGIARAAITHGSVDTADRIIHLLGQAAGCGSTVTFDKRFARQPGVELLG